MESKVENFNINKKLVIGIEAKRAFCNFTGLGNYARNHILSLLSADKNLFLVLFTPKIENLNFLDQLNKFQDQFVIVKPETILEKCFHFLWRSFRIGFYFKKYNIEIYHGLSHELPIFPFKSSKTIEVVTIHDLIFLRNPQFFSSIDRLIYKLKWSLSCQRADYIIAISEQTKLDLIHFLKIQPDKIVTIHQSIAREFYEKIQDDEVKVVKEKFQLNQPFFLYVGDFNGRKNILQIVESFSLTLNCDWQLILIGPTTGDYLEEIKGAIQNLHLENSVRILGKVSFKDLMGIYKLAEVLVYPSLFEGFGIPLVEAETQETAVITSKNCGLEDAGGPHSIYVDPLKSEELKIAMNELICNSEKRNLMKKLGLEYAQNFHPDVIVKHWLKFYEDVKGRSLL
jgi:glycosyltransferase involved in cell wall biosynthesis